MRPWIARSLCLLATAFPPVGAAQDGALDPTFAGDGMEQVEFPSYPLSRAAGVLALPDGRILAYGSACFAHCNPAAARFHRDGTLDTSWSADGKVVFSYAGVFGGDARAARRPDGKVVFVGDMPATETETERIGLARLTAGGLFDATFGAPQTPGSVRRWLPNGAQLVYVRGLKLQSDGKILVGGSGILSGYTDQDMFVARFTENGEPDLPFGSNGVAWINFDRGGTLDDELREIALQPDGRIVLFGRIADDSGDHDIGFARLTSAGDPDPTFGSGDGSTDGRVAWDLPDLFGLANELAFSMTLQGDGRILFSGIYNLPSEETAYFARLLADGAIDPTLPIRSHALHANPILLVQGDGKIVVGGPRGGAGGVDCVIERWNAAGTAIDPTFGDGGTTTIADAAGGDVLCMGGALSGGSVVLAGELAEPSPSIDADLWVARLTGPLFADGFEGADSSLWSATVP